MHGVSSAHDPPTCSPSPSCPSLHSRHLLPALHCAISLSLSLSTYIDPAARRGERRGGKRSKGRASPRRMLLHLREPVRLSVQLLELGATDGDCTSRARAAWPPWIMGEGRNGKLDVSRLESTGDPVESVETRIRALASNSIRNLESGKQRASASVRYALTWRKRALPRLRRIALTPYHHPRLQ